MSDPIRVEGESSIADADVALRTITALTGETSEAIHASNNLSDLLRAASRHIRRLVECRKVRIWVVRRGGRRLVAWDYPEPEGAPAVELVREGGEGLAGWAIAHEQTLRLGPGDVPPLLIGAHESFRSAMVIPLFRRRDVFAAIECLDKTSGAFTDADFDRLDVAAEHVAFALDNALLYQLTERRALEKEVLLEVANALATPLDLEDVIQVILRTLRQVVNYEAAAIYLLDPQSQALRMVKEVGYPSGSEEAFGLQVGQGIVGWVAKTGEAVIVPDVAHDERYVAARSSTRSELALPLKLEGRTIGVFNLENDHVDAYHEGHLELVSAFGALAATAVQRAQLTRELLERRRLEKELAIAREIQLSFLPKSNPTIPGFELAGAALPHDEVGGDYYDFIRVSENRIGLAIADVSGKGIPAALIMAGFRMSLLAEIRNEFALRAVMRKVNSLLYESTDRDKFVTAFYGVLDFRNRMLIFSNAGHNPPILRHDDGQIEYLPEGGVALGVLPDAHFDERPIALRPGDVLVMYTDGVSEAESPTGEQLGTERLEQCIARLADRSAEAIVQGLVDEVSRWAGARGQTDDLTLLVLKVKPEGT